MRHVGILLLLRWRMLLASFAGRRGRRVAAVIGLVAVALWALSFGFSSWQVVKATSSWDPAVAAAGRPLMLRVIFLVTFLLQLMTGVAFLTVSDFFDTSRLLHLPVRARSIFTAMMLSSVLSPSSLVFGAPALGAIAALPGSPGLLAVRVLVVLALVTFGQACALFTGYMLLLALSRRRLRDLATILGSAIGIGSYALIRVVRPERMRYGWDDGGALWDALTYVPTSWFADLVAWDDPLRFRHPAAIVPPALALFAALVLGAWAFGRFYDRAGEGGDGDRTTRAAPRRHRMLSPAIGAVARQTLAIVWREPQLKALLFQQMIFLLIPLFSLSGERDAKSAVWSVPMFIVLSHGWMALSLLGIDGPGLKLLLQSPASRTHVLLGRVVGIGRLLFVIDVVACAALVMLMAVFGGLQDPVRRFAECTAATLVADAVLIGIGALVSVVAPFPLVRRSRNVRMRQEGCATTAGRTVIRLPAMFAAVVVGLLAIAPAFLRVGPAWYLVTVPAGLLVAGVVLVSAIRMGARRLGGREEQIVAALADTGE